MNPMTDMRLRKWIILVFFVPALPAAAESGYSIQEVQLEDERKREEIEQLLRRALSSEDLEEQERLYQRILQMDPLNEFADRKLEQVREKLEALTESRRQEEQALLRDRSKDQLLEAARRDYANREYESAKEKIGRALEIAPGDEEAEQLDRRVDHALGGRRTQRFLFWGLVLGASIALVALLIVIYRRRSGMLESLVGASAGRHFPLQEGANRLGALASEVDIAIEDPNRKISRHHCDVSRNGRHYFVIDHSSNGTFLNDAALPKGQPVPLNPGDRISLAGEAHFRFSLKMRSRAKGAGQASAGQQRWTNETRS